jgi:hypothetical protein
MKPFKVTLVTTLCLCLASFGAAQSKSQKEIQKLYDLMTTLGKSMKIEKLVQSFKNITTTDFRYIDKEDSTLDRDNYTAEIRGQYGNIKKVHDLTNKIIGIKIKGNEIHCSVKSTYDITASRPPQIRAVGWSLSTDVWTKTSKGWKMKSTKTLKEGIAAKK